MMAQLTTLPSGLRIVSEHMDRVETVSVGAWVQVGARHEPVEVNGVSHLLEHMAFKGTARRTARGIAEEIEAVGGHLNAFTSREATAYYAKVMKGDLPLAVDLIADIVQHPTFDEAELARERDVVLQEIGQSLDTPDDLVFDHFQETAFPDQPLGRSVLGRPEVIAGLSRDTLSDYRQHNYRAPAMVLAAAGAVDHDALVKLAENAFADLPDGAPERPTEAAYVGGDRREARPLEQVHLVFGLPGLSVTHDDHYALSVFSTALGGGMSSRLFQEVRENRGLVYSVYSFNSAYADTGVFGIYAGTGAREVTELVPVVFEQLRAAADGPDAAELARARAQIKSGVVMSLESTSARAEQLAGQVLIYGRVLEMREIMERVDGIGPADLARVGARLLEGPLTVAAMGPVEALPDHATLSAALAGEA